MLGEKIRDLRESRNWSQTDLANRLKITRAAVNAWEMNVSNPSIAMLIRLSDIFSVTADYILGLNKKRSFNIDKLSKNDLRLICELIDSLSEKEHNAKDQ